MKNFFNKIFFKSRLMMNRYLKQGKDTEINLKQNFNYNISLKN